MSKDIEQYRPGFEAWARTDRYKFVALNRLPNGEYRHPGVQADWIVWAAGSSTSTSQGAPSGDWRERAAQACENERVDDSTETEGDIAYNKAIDHCKRAIMELDDESEVAAPVDALDARRYRWARDEGCNFVWAEIGAGNFRSGLDEAIDSRMASSAIAASTTQGEG